MKLRERTLRFVSEKNKDGDDANGKRRSTPSLHRRAAEVMNYRLIKKLILIGISIGVITLMMGYSVVSLYNRTGKFSVAVENPMVSFAITLSETPDFITRSARLTNDQQVTLSDFCGDNIPPNVDGMNGSHNGENYLAYTFYCKNIGNTEASMNYELTFNNVTNHVDEAMRVRLYVNGEYKDFAKTSAERGDETHYCDEPFAGNFLVCRDAVKVVEPDEYVKFTVVTWLEGDDQDCKDELIGGQIKFDMLITAKPPIGA